MILRLRKVYTRVWKIQRAFSKLTSPWKYPPLARHSSNPFISFCARSFFKIRCGKVLIVFLGSIRGAKNNETEDNPGGGTRKENFLARGHVDRYEKLIFLSSAMGLLTNFPCSFWAFFKKISLYCLRALRTLEFLLYLWRCDSTFFFFHKLDIRAAAARKIGFLAFTCYQERLVALAKKNRSRADTHLFFLPRKSRSLPVRLSVDKNFFL